MNQQKGRKWTDCEARNKVPDQNNLKSLRNEIIQTLTVYKPLSLSHSQMSIYCVITYSLSLSL